MSVPWGQEKLLDIIELELQAVGRLWMWVLKILNSSAFSPAPSISLLLNILGDLYSIQKKAQNIKWLNPEKYLNVFLFCEIL